MTSPTVILDAARALDIPARDVAQAFIHEHGLVAVTAAGVQYIVVDADTPDGDGKTGVMLFARPDPDRTYSFPVFVPVDLGETTASTPVLVDGDAGTVTDGGTGERLPSLERPPQAGPGSGLEAWAEYAALVGIPAEDLVGLKKADVVALVEALDLGETTASTPVLVDGDPGTVTDG